MTYADDVCNAKKSQGEPKKMAQNITKLKSNKHSISGRITTI